jgi:signal transduction histidine kinase
VALGRARRTAERDGPEHVRLRAQPIRSPGRAAPIGSVVVAISTAPLEHLQHAVLIGSAIIAALVLLAGGIAILSAVNGALRPVAAMTASAEDWSAHDLERRFGLDPAGDELTGLAATLDALLARIAASRRHEQRFAADVAHELKTPIATLRARSEVALNAQGAGADDERRKALEANVIQTERIDETIDTLLAVARREPDPSRDAVDLVALAREFEGVTVSAAAGLPPAEGDVQIIRRAVAPLVDNARRHARSRVDIEVSRSGGLVRLTVRDDGDGLDPALAERAFDPGIRGAGGSDGGAGLGLPLARRMARSCGGDVHAGPGPGGCFVLELPAVASRALTSQ